MSRTFITLFFILAISTVGILSQEPEHPCGKNEVWDECNGLCQPTCLNPILPCPTICAPGCVCKDNYLRNQDGVCIPVGCCDWDNKSSE